MSVYSKCIAAATAALAVAGTVLADGHLSVADAITIAAAALGAVGVYAFPNKPA